ncbi:MAG: DNA-directed RNA polymerase II subunit RPB9, partial [Marteilia pararefringens]
DQAEKRLLLACRNCNYKELTYTNCIYNNRMRHIEDELAQINTDVINDPTMPRMFFAHNCPKCSQSEIVFFQSRSTRPDATMRLYYVCANRQCLHIWSE